MALTGFFTDMALSWFLDRPVIYTPLKICSIYAGVIGAVAAAAGIVPKLVITITISTIKVSLEIIPSVIYQPYFTALIDRNRNGGIGRDIHASRLAGGLSAIGALSLGIGGKKINYFIF